MDEGRSAPRWAMLKTKADMAEKTIETPSRRRARKELVAVVSGHGKLSAVPHRGCPRVLARPRGPGQGEPARGRVVQGGRPRPGIPGGAGAGEQPVLVAQALPLALHQHGHREHAVLSGPLCSLFRVKCDDER